MMRTSGGIMVSRIPPILQRGSVLVVSMLVLLVLTILGVTAMGTATMEERMAGNVLDYDRAFQVSETGLREGEIHARAIVTEPDFNPEEDSDSPSSGEMGDEPHGWYKQNHNWVVERGCISSYGELEKGCYLIEEHDFKPDDVTIGHDEQTGRYIYRITSSGIGQREATQVILQGTYARRF